MNKKVKNLYLSGFITMFLGVLGVIMNNALVLFLLLSIVILPVAIIFMIIEAIRNKTPIYTPAKITMPAPAKNNTVDLTNITTYFVKNNLLKPRKKDGNIIKGSCIIKFENDKTFSIIQDEETINNNISSVYYLDIWEYKDETYYKFVMRSHNEYTLKEIDNEVEIISQQLAQNGINIEDNRARFIDDEE